MNKEDNARDKATRDNMGDRNLAKILFGISPQTMQAHKISYRYLNKGVLRHHVENFLIFISNTLKISPSGGVIR